MSWLYLPKLQNCYQSNIVSALQQGTFSHWERGVFKQAIAEYEQSIMKWVHQGFSTLNQYQKLAEKITNMQIKAEPSKQTTQHYQLQLLQTLQDNLNHELEIVSTKFSP